MRSGGIALTLLVPLAIAVGCGSDSSDRSSGIESKSPEEIVAVSANALRRVESFHMESTDASSGSAKADVGLPKQMRVTVEIKSQFVSMRLVDGSFYMKGNAAFWRDIAGGRAGEIAGRWLRVPYALAKDLRQGLDPKTISRCLVKEHGTLVRGGTATIDGQRAVVVVDKGDRPGTAPGKLYVAATGDPLPLRLITTGKQRPGGRKYPGCSDETRAEAGDVAIFGNYNTPFDVSAPPAAVDFGSATSS